MAGSEKRMLRLGGTAQYDRVECEWDRRVPKLRELYERCKRESVEEDRQDANLMPQIGWPPHFYQNVAMALLEYVGIDDSVEELNDFAHKMKLLGRSIAFLVMDSGDCGLWLEEKGWLEGGCELSGRWPWSGCTEEQMAFVNRMFNEAKLDYIVSQYSYGATFKKGGQE